MFTAERQVGRWSLAFILVMCFGCAAPRIAAVSEDVTGMPPDGYLVPGILLDAESWEESAGEERLAPSSDITVLKVSDRGLDLVTQYEGFIPRPYSDPIGLCTIGFGHLIKKARCNGSEQPSSLDRETGRELLRQDIGKVERAVMALVVVPLNQNQFDAICDFVYNVGVGAFKRSTLRQRINAQKFGEVPIQLERWTKAGGRILSGLVARRRTEGQLFLEGLDVERTTASADDDVSAIDIRVGE